MSCEGAGQIVVSFVGRLGNPKSSFSHSAAKVIADMHGWAGTIVVAGC